MNLNEYLTENDRHIGDVVILNSVGTALDKVSGDTFPMMVDNTIGVDEPMNIMEMEINGDSYDWLRHYLIMISQLLMRLWLIYLMKNGLRVILVNLNIWGKDNV